MSISYSSESSVALMNLKLGERESLQKAEEELYRAKLKIPRRFTLVLIDFPLQYLSQMIPDQSGVQT